MNAVHSSFSFGTMLFLSGLVPLAVAEASSSVRSVAGVWNSKLGTVTLQHAAPTAAGPIAVAGFHDESRDHRAELRNGTFDPATGTLVFTYFQPWRNVIGTGRFVLSADGQRLSGTYSQPGATGPWNLERAPEPAAAGSNATPAQAATAQSSGVQLAIALAGALLGVKDQPSASPAAVQPSASPTPPPPQGPAAVPTGALSRERGAAGPIAMAPGTVNYFERGKALLAAGDNRGAVEAFTKALEQDPSHAAAYRERARTLNRLQDYRAGLADAERAIALNPKDAVAVNLRGNAKSRLGDTTGAIADYSQAITLDPKYASALANRGGLRRAANDYAGAMQDYDRALEFAPRDVNALWGRADVKALTGDHAGALRDYDQAIAVNPKNAGILSNRGYVLMQMRDYQEAMTTLNRALKIDPKHVNALTNRGISRGKLGDLAGAQADLKLALTLDPKNTSALTGMAEVQKQQRDAATAAVAVAAPVTPAPSARTVVATAPPPARVATSQTVAAVQTKSADRMALAQSREGPPAPDVPRTVGTTAEAKPADESRAVPTAKAQSGVPTAMPAPADTAILRGGATTPSTPVATATQLAEGQWILVDQKRVENVVEPERVGKIVCGEQNCSIEVRSGRPVKTYTIVAGWTIPPASLKPNESFIIAGSLTDSGSGFGRLYLPKHVVENGALKKEYNPRWRAAKTKGETQQLEYRVVAVDSAKALFSVSYVYKYEWSGPTEQERLAARKARTESPIATMDSLPPVLEVQTDPAGKKELRADGRDGLMLKVRVKPEEAAASAAAQKATESVVFAAEGESGKWVDFSATEMRDGWKVIYVQASNPDPVRGGANKPPATLPIRARASDGDRQLSRLITLNVAPEAVIDAKPDTVEFAAQSGTSAEVRVAIENAGSDPWKFRTEYEAKNRALAAVDVRPVDGKSAVLTLKESGLDPLHDGSNDERAVLRIYAEQKDRNPLERHIKVAVAQEGLFVSTTGRDPNENLFRLRGDGSGRATEIEFRVFALDPELKKMANLTKRAEVLKDITVECLEAKGTIAANVLEVGQLTQEFAGVRGVNDPAGVLRLALPKEVPGDGRLIPCDFRITYGGRSEEPFSAIVTLGVVTTSNGPGSNDWQVELARCQEIINKFVPAAYYPKMQAMLDRRKITLGPQGLHGLRQKIWSAAVELTLGEGGRGYADEAKWAGAITETLEWSQWAGDMAFGAVIGTWTGPYGALGASSLKTAVISALNAYQEGRSADEWLWENLCTIPGILEGKIIDVDTFEKLGMENKAKAWAVFIGYHFCKNLYNGATVVDALTNTAKAVGGDVLSSWLGAEVRKSGHMAVSSWAGAKGQELGAAAKSTVTKAPDPVIPIAATKPVGAEAAPAQKAQTPAKTTAGPPVAKAPAKPASEPGSRVASAPAATPPSKAPGSAEPTKVAPTGPEAKPPGSRAELERTPAAKTGSETDAKVARTGDEPSAKAKPDDGIAAKPEPEPTPAEVAEAVALVRNRTVVISTGKRYAHTDTVLAIMRDPSMVRALKNAPPEVQEAFSNTREAIYRQHDKAVVQHIKDTMPDMKNRIVRVLEFRTPGATGPSLNTDRDYRVCYFSAGGQWIEIKRSKWEDVSYKTFAHLTHGPAGSAEEARHWAEKHQQLGTDKFHSEASPDFSDQRKVWNPETRRIETIQIVPSIVALKGGEAGARLQDPQALGHMYQVKVGDARFPHEKFVQAQKAVKELDAVRDSYAKQDRRVGRLPQSVVNGMKAVLEVNKKLAADPNRRDPKAVEQAEKALRENGFRDLNDFMNKLSSQFESLKIL